jgi:hypothetical protein
LRQRTHARAHALVGWLSGRLDLSVRPCGRARGVAGVGVVYHLQTLHTCIADSSSNSPHLNESTIQETPYGDEISSTSPNLNRPTIQETHPRR